VVEAVDVVAADADVDAEEAVTITPKPEPLKANKLPKLKGNNNLRQTNRPNNNNKEMEILVEEKADADEAKDVVKDAVKDAEEAVDKDEAKTRTVVAREEVEKADAVLTLTLLTPVISLTLASN
jgi:uncharacterized membrane protein